MNSLFHSRRYLASVQSRRLPHRFTDCLVIGAGVAGLRAAIAAAEFGEVLVLSKSAITESNSYHAQGGVAAVVDTSDSIEAHVADTLVCGAGLCDEAAVRQVVAEGPARIEELIRWGARFDTDEGRLIFGLEGGHSTARILHAHGDATGREIAICLLERARSLSAIQIDTDVFVLDLITDEAGRCRGALAWRADRGLFLVWARCTILASGGAGQLYRETTNPTTATADGHAIAWRAGARLADMEMIQFHPTTLYVAGAGRTLISEAVRGEGAHLLDRNGRRFMLDVHPQAELAPRDIVSRAIVRQMAATGASYVLLDVRHLGRERFAQRFPNISELLAKFDIDPGTTPIPVRPAAHYMIGGAVIDADGRTNVENLFACGEAACSGLHGANRLASNSLLEGLVHGHRSGQAAGRVIAANGRDRPLADLNAIVEPSDRTELDLVDVGNSLRSLMGRNAGVERTGERLDESAEIIDFWARYVMDKTFADPAGWMLQNMLTVSALVVASAQRRTESRGVHYRCDYPRADDEHWRCHQELARDKAVQCRPSVRP